MDNNIEKLTSVLLSIVEENKILKQENERIKNTSVIIDKKDAKRFVSDVDCLLGYARKAAGGHPISWEDVVSDMGFDVYNGLNQIRKQI